MSEGMALIRWSHHHTTVQALFATLRQSGELADMTVTNGATSLRCHRLVLSAACPNFLKLLKKCSGDVVLYLGAVHSSVLEALVQYMYCGSVHIDRCRLNEFVQLATQWGVRGVCGREGVSITRTGCVSDAVGGTVAEPCSSPPPPPSPPALSATSLSALKDDVSQLPPADDVSRRPLPGAASRVGGGGGSCASDASDQQRQAVAPPPSHRTRHSSMDTSDSDSEKRLNPSMMSDLSCSVRPQTARAAAGSGSARKKMEKSAKLSVKKTKSATKKAKSTNCLSSGGGTRLRSWQCPHCCRHYVKAANFRSHLYRLHQDLSDIDCYRCAAPPPPLRSTISRSHALATVPQNTLSFTHLSAVSPAATGGATDQSAPATAVTSHRHHVTPDQRQTASPSGAIAVSSSSSATAAAVDAGPASVPSLSAARPPPPGPSPLPATGNAPVTPAATSLSLSSSVSAAAATTTSAGAAAAVINCSANGCKATGQRSTPVAASNQPPPSPSCIRMPTSVCPTSSATSATARTGVILPPQALLLSSSLACEVAPSSSSSSSSTTASTAVSYSLFGDSSAQLAAPSAVVVVADGSSEDECAARPERDHVSSAGARVWPGNNNNTAAAAAADGGGITHEKTAAVTVVRGNIKIERSTPSERCQSFESTAVSSPSCAASSAAAARSELAEAADGGARSLLDSLSTSDRQCIVPLPQQQQQQQLGLRSSKLAVTAAQLRQLRLARAARHNDNTWVCDSGAGDGDRTGNPTAPVTKTAAAAGGGDNISAIRIECVRGEMHEHWSGMGGGSSRSSADRSNDWRHRPRATATANRPPPPAAAASYRRPLSSTTVHRHSWSGRHNHYHVQQQYHRPRHHPRHHQFGGGGGSAAYNYGEQSRRYS